MFFKPLGFRPPYSCAAFALLVLAAALPSGLWGQEKEPRIRPRHDARKFMGHGLCKRLEGKVLILPVLVETPGAQWTTERLEYLNTELKKALEWLHAQAETHGIGLEIRNGLAEGLALHTHCPYAKGKQEVDTRRLVRKSLGTLKLWANVRRARRQTGIRQVALLFLLPEKGRSHAFASYPCTFFPEYAVILAEGMPGSTQKLLASILAHEFLHLFGAADAYFPDSKRPDDPESNPVQAAKVFKGEVMYESKSDITRLSLSPYTAYLIGWRPDCPAEFRRFLALDK